MAIIFMLLLFAVVIGFDYFESSWHPAPRIPVGTMYTTPGFEMLGTLAQDGGTLVEDTFLGEGI